MIDRKHIQIELKRTNGTEGKKLRIYGMYQHHPTKADAVAFLKEEYGYLGHSAIGESPWGCMSYPSKGMVFDHSKTGERAVVQWDEIESILRDLVWSGQYLTADEIAAYKAIPNHEKIPEPRYGWQLYDDADYEGPTWKSVIAPAEPECGQISMF